MYWMRWPRLVMRNRGWWVTIKPYWLGQGSWEYEQVGLVKQQGLCWRFWKLPSGEVNEPWWTMCWKRWETTQLPKFLSLWKFLAQMGSWACSLPQSLAIKGDVAPKEEDLLLSIWGCSGSQGTYVQALLKKRSPSWHHSTMAPAQDTTPT